MKGWDSWWKQLKSSVCVPRHPPGLKLTALIWLPAGWRPALKSLPSFWTGEYLLSGGVITDRKFNLVERASDGGRERTSARKSSRVNFLTILLLLLLLHLLSAHSSCRQSVWEENRSNTDPQLTFTLNSLMVALDDSWSQAVTVLQDLQRLSDVLLLPWWLMSLMFTSCLFCL